MTETSEPVRSIVRVGGVFWLSHLRKLLLHLRAATASHTAWTLLLLLFCLGVQLPLEAKPKREKFRGSVVAVGPKAITVKSHENIYLVRTFNYSPELEKSILRHKPQQGARVTVHYLAGNGQAVKVE